MKLGFRSAARIRRVTAAALAPVALSALAVGVVTAPAATAAVKDPVLVQSDYDVLPNGKTAYTRAEYRRALNQVTVETRVTSPYLFYGARNSYRVTLNDSRGQIVWSYSGSTTVCGTADFTCPGFAGTAYRKIDLAVSSSLASRIAGISVSNDLRDA